MVKRDRRRRREGASTSRSAKGKYARWEGWAGGSENNEFATGTCLGALQNESYLPAMIAALHGLIAAADVTKGYADHEFVIGSLNDLSARSTCPMTAASSRRQHNRSPYIKYNFFPLSPKFTRKCRDKRS